MAVTLDPTVGGASSNTYVTRSDATSYLEASFYASAWDTKGESEQDIILVRATRILDAHFAFLGTKADSAQALQWPREGTDYDTDAIPQAVKDAESLLAGWLAAQDGTTDPFGGVDTGSLASLAVTGAVAMTFRDLQANAGSDFLSRAVRPILSAGKCVQGGATIRLTR